ncbi:MAG: hypothetical protein GX557_16105 [Chloroflexi bacterium]|nr:hypothetical protein [Chloroflexota bacterium]
MPARLRVALLVLALLLVTQHFWLFPEGVLPSPSRDLKVLLLPALMAREQVRAGEVPWTSPWFSREPNLANPLWGLLYPPMALLAALPAPLSLRVYVVLHLLIGLLAMRTLLAALVRRPVVADWGALVYACTGPWGSHLTCYHLELLASLAWLPLVAYAWLRLSRSDGGRDAWRPALLLAVLMAGLVYSGAMYALLFAALCILVASGTLLLARDASWRQLRWVGAAALAAVVLSAPKLVPSLLNAGRARPAFTSLEPRPFLSGLVMATEAWWTPGRGVWDSMAGGSGYVSLAVLILAAYGVSAWWRNGRSGRGLGLLLCAALLVYWGFGLPPFGIPAPLVGFRAGSRVLLCLCGMIVIAAAVGLDALLAEDQRAARPVVALALVALAVSALLVLLRGLPDLAGWLGATDRQLVVLRGFPWRLWPGVALGLAAVLLVVLAWWNARTLPRRALVLALTSLLSLAPVTAIDALLYESDPQREDTLLALREQVAGRVVGLAGFSERDIQDRVSYVLTGHTHLLNPGYSSLGQDVSPGWLARLEYVVSGRRISGDLELPRTWFPWDTLGAVPAERLALVGRYATEDPFTRNDLPATQRVADLPAEPDTATLWLYRVSSPER